MENVIYNTKEQKTYPRSVRTWLLIGVVMVLVQVLVGGITRLTESGLSITKWEVVSGTLPPLTAAAWDEAYLLYQATPQYREVNEGISMSDFKFIYFWEWVHRFWARIMGFVFLIPFLYFFGKGYLDKQINLRLLVVVLLAALAAIFGWIMVASGLVQRPWVNAYKLSIHLTIAFAVFASLFWTYLWSRGDIPALGKEIPRRNLLKYLFLVYIVQMLLGGILSGMKAAVVYPTWPDMNGVYLPGILFDLDQWTIANLINYDLNPFMPALIHFLHRNIAYILFLFGILLMMKFLKSGENKFLKRGSTVFIVILLCQVLLGILTVISSQGHIPVLLGTMHQGFALLLLGSFVYTFFVLRIK
jgi:cytochrome c oxidase assembly protein subunit 15